jgi:excisionase family DNA binding protein
MGSTSTDGVGVLLGAAEVARRLGVSRQTVYRLVREGSLPAVRLGGPDASLRIREDGLERWLADHEVAR